MTQLKRFVAISAAVALAAAWNNVMAQDDLDDLLRDLEADVAPAKPAAQKPADAKPADGKATAPAQEPAKKAEAEKPAPKQPAPAKPADVKPADGKVAEPAPLERDAVVARRIGVPGPGPPEADGERAVPEAWRAGP